MSAAELPTLLVADHHEWRAWLDGNHAQSSGVWLMLAKKGSTQPTSLRYDQALEEALCYGWIDGQIRGGDSATYRQRFTPRRPRSAWSRTNVERVERLSAEGRMREAGIAAVQRAQEDGRWEAAYAGAATIEVPEDLAVALAANPSAQAMFDRLNAQNRYAILYRTTTARRADTRANRIERFVAMLARGETIYPQ